MICIGKYIYKNFCVAVIDVRTNATAVSDCLRHISAEFLILRFDSVCTDVYLLPLKSFRLVFSDAYHPTSSAGNIPRQNKT